MPQWFLFQTFCQSHGRYRPEMGHLERIIPRQRPCWTLLAWLASKWSKLGAGASHEGGQARDERWCAKAPALVRQGPDGPWPECRGCVISCGAVFTLHGGGCLHPGILTRNTGT